MRLAHYGIGLCLMVLGVYLGLQPGKLDRIGFGGPGGAVPKEIPPLPRSIQLFMAAELLCFGVTVFAWDVVVHKEFFTVIGVFLFMVTWSAISIAAGFSARQQPGFTLKTASRVRSYRITAFIYAAVGVTVLLLFFLLPLMQHR